MARGAARVVPGPGAHAVCREARLEPGRTYPATRRAHRGRGARGAPLPSLLLLSPSSLPAPLSSSASSLSLLHPALPALPLSPSGAGPLLPRAPAPPRPHKGPSPWQPRGPERSADRGPGAIEPRRRTCRYRGGGTGTMVRPRGSGGFAVSAAPSQSALSGRGDPGQLPLRGRRSGLGCRPCALGSSRWPARPAVPGRVGGGSGLARPRVPSRAQRPLDHLDPFWFPILPPRPCLPPLQAPRSVGRAAIVPVVQELGGPHPPAPTPAAVLGWLSPGFPRGLDPQSGLSNPPLPRPLGLLVRTTL